MQAPASALLVVPSDRDRRLARYAVAAIAASLVEAAIPSPLPGVKPGLANIVILIVLARHGWRDAAWVSALRVVAGSLLAGQFLAPGFFLAAAGALCSLAVLGRCSPFRGIGWVPSAARWRPRSRTSAASCCSRGCGWCRTTGCSIWRPSFLLPRCCSARSMASSLRG
jgi:hypothetical protein